MDKDKAELYALLDPDNNTIRYIGYTINPEKRLKSHIYNCTTYRERNCHRCHWISKLKNNNKYPIYKTLFVVDKDKVKNLEIQLISHYKQFSKLVNNTKGGDGISGFKWTEEQKAKLKGRKFPKWKLWKAVIITNIKTKEEIEFPCAEKASEYIRCSISSVKHCIDGQRNSVFGYTCKYKSK